jgi:hypothetical protein
MNAQALVQQLIAWLQEERAAQCALTQALDGLERALRAGDRTALEREVRGLEAALAGSDQRALRQRQMREACQRFTGLAARELDLADVIEHAARAGADVGILERARLELRELVRTLALRARSLAVLVRHQRGVLGDLLALLGRGGEADPADARGMLLDAEA